MDATIEAALAAHQAGLLAQAEQLYLALLQQTPLHLEAFAHLWWLRAQTGRFAEARAAILQAPDSQSPLWQNLAQRLQTSQQWPELLLLAEAGCERWPDEYIFASQRGATLDQLGRNAEALPCLLALQTRFPEQFDQWFALGRQHMRQEQLCPALRAFQIAAQQHPDDEWTHRYLATVQQNLGDEESMLTLLNYISRHPATASAAYSQLLFDCAHRDFSVEETRELYAGFNRLYIEPRLAANPPRPRYPVHAPIRLGFLSGDFCGHVVQYILLPLIRHLDRQKIALYLYHCHDKIDQVTAEYQAQEVTWRSVAHLNENELVRVVRDDQLDVVIDLALHSGFNRQLALGQRLAPLQLTWLGYLGGSGNAAIDYQIADRYLFPENETLQHPGIEPPAFIEDGFIACAPICPLEAKPLPALQAGYLTYAALNRADKWTDSMLDCYARILQLQPTAQLILLGRGSNDPETRERLIQRLARHGLPLERIELHGRVSKDEFNQLLDRTDMALDSYPYSGGITTIHALCRGVPVVSLVGQALASRYAQSLYGMAGIDGWIANDTEQFIHIAQQAAQDLTALAALRARLPDQLTHSTLFDTAGFAARFTTLLQALTTTS